MVTGEDYQLGPLTVSQDIVKAKSVNRTSSGISRYFDLVDATGKYSTTNLFGTDGAIYKNNLTLKSSFNFETLTDIEGQISNTIEPILSSIKVRNYYYDNFPKLLVEDLGATWTELSSETNNFTGRLTNSAGVLIKVGTFTSSNMKFVKSNSLLKFVPPEGFHFLNGKLESGLPDFRGGTTYKWVKVVSVDRDGTQIKPDSTGPIVFNDQIPSNSKLIEIRTAIPSSLTDDVKAQITAQIFSYRTFGLRFSRTDGEWRLITENNLAANSNFSTGKTGDTTNSQLDASWLLKFNTDGDTYTITHRAMRYIFESDQDIRFYYDSSDKIYNNKTGKIVKDKINVLNINTKPDSLYPFNLDYFWEIVEEYRDAEGYVDSKKIEISFFDDDDDGVVDNPEIFDDIVNEEVNPNSKIVFLKKNTSTDGVEDFVYTSKEAINVLVIAQKSGVGALSAYDDGQLFYFVEEDIFETFNLTTATLTITTDYKARVGRDTLKFQYIHAADQNSRIDPSASNIIDTYMLTKGYDTLFRKWLDGDLDSKPLPPSNDELYISYATNLNKIKSLSDEIIYHPVKYKILFGNKAKEDLQSTFKIVKNPDLVLNDNEIKSKVISAINKFFALDNWDFGDRFYFSELSSYVMSQLSPNLVTFIIVPVQLNQSYGSLQEIKSESDEIFISGATVENIEIIDAITAGRLRSSGAVVTSITSSTSGIQSNTDTNNTSSGGLSY